MKGRLQVGYNIVRCGDGYYIAGEEGREKGKSEGKSAEFIPEKKKIVIYTREKLQKQGFSSSCYIPCIPIGLVGIALYPIFSIGI